MSIHQETIDIDKDVYDRSEKKRQDTQNEHAPEMTESVIFSSLLDPVEGVNQGYYDDD